MEDKMKLKKIQTVTAIITIGFTLSVIFNYILGNYFNYEFPNGTFLFTPVDKFNDFFNAYRHVEGFNPYSEILAQRIYFPFGYLIVGLFTFFEKNVAFYIYQMMFILFLLTYLYKSTSSLVTPDRMKNTFIIFFMSYPVLFVLDRANFETIVFIFLALFVYFYQQNRIKTSVVFLAMAVSMKLAPLVFIVIFLCDKRYKEVLLTGGLSILLTLVSLLIFEGDLTKNVSFLLESLNLYNRDYVIGHSGLGWGHSLFGVLKLFCMAIADFLHLNSSELIKISMRPYLIFVLILFSLISAYIIKFETDLWKKMLLLVIAMNLFPYVSADYKLIHFFIPLVLFFISRSDDDSHKKYAILFGLLFIPKSYFYFYHWASISIILNPLIMCMAIVYVMKDKYDVLKNNVRVKN